MNEKLEQDLFPAAMTVNNLEFEKIDGQLIIRKTKNKNSSLQGRITLAIIGLSIGLLVFIFIWIRLGLMLMIGSGVFFFTLMNLREKEKNAEKKLITIDREKIAIKEGYKTRRINLQDITEFKTNVQRVENMFVGKITIISEDKWPYEFLEIFGNNRDLVQDDLLIISNHIVENYL